MSYIKEARLKFIDDMSKAEVLNFEHEALPDTSGCRNPERTMNTVNAVGMASTTDNSQQPTRTISCAGAIQQELHHNYPLPEDVNGSKYPNEANTSWISGQALDTAFGTSKRLMDHKDTDTNSYKDFKLDPTVHGKMTVNSSTNLNGVTDTATEATSQPTELGKSGFDLESTNVRRSARLRKLTEKGLNYQKELTHKNFSRSIKFHKHVCSKCT